MLVPQRLNRSKFIALIIITVAAVALMLYLLASSFWGGRGSVPSEHLTPAIIGVAPIKTDFAADLLNREPYTKLKQHGELPVSVGAVGRDNPFEPADGSQPETDPGAPATTTTPGNEFLFNF